jgi:hypothetical protein
MRDAHLWIERPLFVHTLDLHTYVKGGGGITLRDSRTRLENHKMRDGSAHTQIQVNSVSLIQPTRKKRRVKFTDLDFLSLAGGKS